jgi:hypothetical protein
MGGIMKIILLITLSLGLFNCSRAKKNETSQVTIQLPVLQNSSSVGESKVSLLSQNGTCDSSGQGSGNCPIGEPYSGALVGIVEYPPLLSTALDKDSWLNIAPTGYNLSSSTDTPINCYMVVVSDVDNKNQLNSCRRADHTDLNFTYISELVAPLSTASSSISLDVPTGKNLIFTLIGCYTADP